MALSYAEGSEVWLVPVGGQWYKREQEPEAQPSDCGATWTELAEWSQGKVVGCSGTFGYRTPAAFRMWASIMVRRPLMRGMPYRLDRIQQTVWTLGRHLAP